LLSFIVFILLINNSFKKVDSYSVIASIILYVSISYKIYTIARKGITNYTFLNRIGSALLITIGLLALLQALGIIILPFFYVLMPIVFTYTGWVGAALAVLLSSVFFVTHHEIHNFNWIFPLLISTFGLGYFIRRNIDKPVGTRNKLERIDPKNVRTLFHDEREIQRAEFDPNKMMELKQGLRKSIEILNEILSPHTIVLYLKGKDGLFTIEDFISKSSNSIDSGQKLNFRTGYFGWVLKTNTPFLAQDLKTGNKNLFYYKNEARIKSLLIAPVKIKRDDDSTESSEKIIGMLVVDSLRKEAFGSLEKSIVSIITERIEQAIENYKLSKKMVLNSKELRSIYEFTMHLNAFQQLESKIDHVLKTLNKFLETDFIGLTTSSHDTNTSRLMRVLNRNLDGLEDTTISHQNTLIGLGNKNNAILYFDDLSSSNQYRSVFGNELDFALGIKSINSILISPLMETSIDATSNKQLVLGCLVAGRKTVTAFNERERSLVSYISQETAHVILQSLNYIKIKELAIKDGLTGLYNQSHLQEMLFHALDRSDRYPEKVSLIMIDVDNLKEINDKFGHKIGDSVLSSVGRTISRSIRKIDIPARYGGDEFAIVLPNTDKENAVILANKLKNSFGKVTLSFEAEPENITMSFGLATYPDNASTKDSLIEKADRALYESKRGGKNQITHYEDISLTKAAMQHK